jgi:hypothetical protein
MEILDISISGPAEQVKSLILGLQAKAASVPPAPVFEPLRTSAMPRIGEPWPNIPGSAYAGLARGLDGEDDGHLVLLADKPAELLDWQAAVDWAKGLGEGARLPTRFESALLYANLQDRFDTERYHWTGSQYSAGLAWYQSFGYGGQNLYGKSYEARARAVRRFTA